MPIFSQFLILVNYKLVGGGQVSERVVEKGLPYATGKGELEIFYTIV